MGREVRVLVDGGPLTAHERRALAALVTVLGSASRENLTPLLGAAFGVVVDVLPLDHG